MAVLTDNALEFARAHITKYYDSDFFPTADEFEAIWSDWDAIKKSLLAPTASGLDAGFPRILAAPKHHGGLRIVHQLEPLPAIVYTALAYITAFSVEAARQPRSAEIAFSYRIKPANGNFFSGGNGYEEFVTRCAYLAHNHSYAMVVDIADFYNRIYLHRLNGALSRAMPSKPGVAKDVETFISSLNQKASQGIPVGPAASIIFSEATLIDIDEWIKHFGLAHARYVDDIHIFADSVATLQARTEQLVTYLHEAHRLQISWQKYRLLASEDYVARYLRTPKAVEGRELLTIARKLSEYDDHIDESDLDSLVERYLTPAATAPAAPKGPPTPTKLGALLLSLRKEETRKRGVIRRLVLEELLRLATQGETLDIGLARHVLRRGRSLRATGLLNPVLERFELLGPVLRDVFVYLDSVATPALLSKHASVFSKAFDSPFVSSHRFVRHWVEWFRSRHPALRDTTFFESAAIEHQARAARRDRNLAWVRDQKSRFGSLGPWDRRAVLMAAEVMPKDERKPWVNSVTGSSTDVVEKAVRAWLLKRP